MDIEEIYSSPITTSCDLVRKMSCANHKKILIPIMKTIDSSVLGSWQQAMCTGDGSQKVTTVGMRHTLSVTT